MTPPVAQNLARPLVSADGAPAAAQLLLDRAAYPAPSGAAAPWLLSPATDFFLFLGVTLLTLIPWAVSDLLGYPGVYVMIGVAFVNGPHLISTWTRIYLLPSERFRRPFHYWVMPALAAAFVIANELRGLDGRVLVRSVIFYWASWHFVAQSWGVLRIYQRKHGVAQGQKLEAALERWLIFGPALFCVLRRLYTGPWTLFGLEVLHVRPPALAVNGLGALLCVLSAVYLGRLIATARTRPRHEYVRPLYLGFNFLGFAMPFIVIRDGTSAFAAAALWHAVQYVAIVWVHNRRQFRRGIDPSARLLSWASQPGRSLAYMGLIAACAAGVYSVAFVVARVASLSFEHLAMTFWMALTLGHYYVDGVIWKTRRYDLKTLG
jgi:hypothetical protein